MNILNGIEAADRRIEEQQRRSRQFADMGRNFASARAEHENSQNRQIPPASPQPPLQNNEVRNEQPARTEEKPTAPAADNNTYFPENIIKNAAESLAAALNTDSDRLLLLMLMILLSSQNADPALLIALAYILL